MDHVIHMVFCDWLPSLRVMFPGKICSLNSRAHCLREGTMECGQHTMEEVHGEIYCFEQQQRLQEDSCFQIRQLFSRTPGSILSESRPGSPKLYPPLPQLPFSFPPTPNPPKHVNQEKLTEINISQNKEKKKRGRERREPSPRMLPGLVGRADKDLLPRLCWGERGHVLWLQNLGYGGIPQKRFTET